MGNAIALLRDAAAGKVEPRIRGIKAPDRVDKHVPHRRPYCSAIKQLRTTVWSVPDKV